MSEKNKSRYNEKRNKYTQNFIHNKYDQLAIRLPKTGTDLSQGRITRQDIAGAAEMSGCSVNAYIIAAVKEKMQREGFNIARDQDEKPEDAEK